MQGSNEDADLAGDPEQQGGRQMDMRGLSSQEASERPVNSRSAKRTPDGRKYAKQLGREGAMLMTRSRQYTGDIDTIKLKRQRSARLFFGIHEDR